MHGNCYNNLVIQRVKSYFSNMSSTVQTLVIHHRLIVFNAQNLLHICIQCQENMSALLQNFQKFLRRYILTNSSKRHVSQQNYRIGYALIMITEFILILKQVLQYLIFFIGLRLTMLRNLFCSDSLKIHYIQYILSSISNKKAFLEDFLLISEASASQFLEIFKEMLLL